MIEWTSISDITPDPTREVVAMSPNGVAHITHWRPSCDIFGCQQKCDDSWDWKWAYLGEEQ